MAAAAEVRRAGPGADLVGFRRTRSEPRLLRRTLMVAPRAAPLRGGARSVGIFSPLQLPAPIVPHSAEPLPLDSEESPVEGSGSGPGRGRANWVERVLQVRTRWRGRQHKEEEGEDDDELCGVSYDSSSSSSSSEEGREWDRESFARVLGRVALAEAKRFAQLALLCNLAYAIPEIQAGDLKKRYDLHFVTSSLEKKSVAAAIKSELETDSTRPPPPTPTPTRTGPDTEPRRPFRPSVAYGIAASAASYVHSRARGLLSLGDAPRRADENAAAAAPARGGGGGGRLSYKSEVAACVAASTVTAVVAAEEEARQEAAKDLRSPLSSPCEWFVCDEPATHTRCFIIQGSDSLASWQANLLFEPTTFEDTGVLVHRGIYEAAKGIYDRFMPEIEAHQRAHGERARLRFSGHSLGGSLALLVSLMLLARGAAVRAAVLPVVTFGAPSVFCGGERVLGALGLDDGHLQAVIMHRDIVPRAFSCSYPNQAAMLLKRLNAAFRSHPCLNNERVLYSPLGKTYILQPDEKSSAPHPLLPDGAALYAIEEERRGAKEEDDAPLPTSKAAVASALRTFMNSPHPLETLSDPRAYGSDGTIRRDHESSNYAKALDALVKQQQQQQQRVKPAVRWHAREHQWLPQQWWPPLVSMESPGLVAQEVISRS